MKPPDSPKTRIRLVPVDERLFPAPCPLVAEGGGGSGEEIGKSFVGRPSPDMIAPEQQRRGFARMAIRYRKRILVGTRGAVKPGLAVDGAPGGTSEQGEGHGQVNHAHRRGLWDVPHE